MKVKLEDLFNVTVNFIFEDKFIGEMQFSYGDHSKSYDGNHFLYEIERSQAKIEII